MNNILELGEQMSKIYLCGKLGKSVKFNSDSWNSGGGDCESPELLRKMAELNPNDTFIIISRNDVDRNRDSLNLPSNLVDVYNGATPDEKKDYHYITKRLKDVKIDGCFLMSGPTANCNIPEKSYKRTELKHGHKQFAKSLMVFANYVAPMYNFLNDSNIPWVMIANDPRYIRQGNDLANQPKMIMSQYNETIRMQTFDNWEDQNYIKNDIKSIYAGMEKMFLIDKQIPTSFKKTKKFMVVLNEGNNGAVSRYTELKKYVLDYINDVEIYGKWDEETITNDTRFKGSVKFAELQSMLGSVKYSFMISIADGWVTMKVWELLSHGIIPFMHPNYDTQKHCNLPDFIRINNPTELHDKIEFLENNPEEYTKLLKECLSQITIDDTSGKTLSNTILNYTPSVNKAGAEFKIITNIKVNSDEW